MTKTSYIITLIMLIGCAPRKSYIDLDVADDTGSVADDTGDTGDTGIEDDTGETGPVDADSDGYTDDVDCDDNDPNVNPEAVEDCNGIDDDCDGVADEGVITTYYRDFDYDGYGDPSVSEESCEGIVGYVTDNTDCDDYDDELNQDDVDEDGWTTCDGDCDDEDDSRSPGLSETWYDDIDTDCAEDNDYDADADGFDAEPWGDDCDDSAAYVWPGATETWYDGIDADCDGWSDYDADGDGFDAESWGDDCDDSTTDVGPEAPEDNTDGVDSNCNGLTDEFNFDAEWGPVSYNPDDWNLTLTIDDMSPEDPGVSSGKFYVWLDDDSYVRTNALGGGLDLYADVGHSGWGTVEYDGYTMTAEITNSKAWAWATQPQNADYDDPDASYLMVLYTAPDFDDTLASGYICYTKQVGDGVDWSGIADDLKTLGITPSDCQSL